MTTSSDRTREDPAAHGVGPASAPAPRRARVTFFMLATGLALVDLVLKEVAEARLVTPVDLGVLQLRLVYNPGVAFSLGQSVPGAVVLAATAAITVGVAGFAYATAPRGGFTYRLGLAAIVAGAAANVIDRAGDGVVTDYLHTGWFPTFNLADTWITLGAVVLVASMLINDRHAATDN